MVTTRGRKAEAKRKEPSWSDEDDTTSTGGTDDDSDYEEEKQHAERLLQKAAMVRSDRAKKQRVERFQRLHPPLEMLPPEIMRYVMLFLDQAQDIMSLSLLSKHLRQSITGEIVVRAAVFSGGKARDACGEVMRLVESKAIHVPTDFRMLRLVNAKRCERMDQCYEYNTVKRVSANTTKAKRPFGMNICPTCVKGTSACLIPYYNHFAVGDVRVAKAEHTRLLLQRQVEAVTKNSIGPFIIGMQVKQIESSYEDDADKTAQIDKIAAKVEAETSAEDKTRADVLVTAWKDAEQHYDAFVRSKADVVRNKHNAGAVARRERKMKNSKAIYAKIELALEGWEHKDRVLECTWHEYAGHCTYKVQLARDILHRLTQAPSYTSNKRITDRSQEIREAVDLLESNGFLGGDNFPEFLANSEHRFDRALYQYARAEITAETILKNAGSNFVAFVRENKLTDALITVLHSGDKATLFAREVVDDNCGSPGPSWHNAFAKQIWLHGGPPAFSPDQSLLQHLRLKFDHRCGQYRVLRRNMRRYLRNEETKQFLQEQGPPAHRPDQTFTRRHALYKTYTGLVGIGHVRRQEFSELRSLHRRIFENPRNFGYPPR